MTMMCDVGTAWTGSAPPAAAAMKMWRRTGSTGRDAAPPTSRPIGRAQGPAAFTTVRVSIVPRVVSTPLTRPPTRRDARDLDVALDRDAGACAAFANPIVTPFGSAMPSRRQNVAAITPSVSRPGASCRASARVEPLHVDAEAALKRRRSAGTSRRSPATRAGTDSRPGESRSGGRPRRRSARAGRSIRSTAGCSPRSRTDGARRRRSARSIRSPSIFSRSTSTTSVTPRRARW